MNKNYGIYIGVIFVISMFIIAIVIITNLNNSKHSIVDPNNTKVSIIISDSCGYQDGVLYLMGYIIVDTNITNITIPIFIDDLIYSEFKYGDGKYATTVRNLICK